jgi:hypothetical protein
MDPGQQSDRIAAIDLPEKIRRIGLSEVGLAERQDTRRRIDVANFGKTLGAEQFLGDVLGSQADPCYLRQAHGRRFEDTLRGSRTRRADEAGAAG